MAKTPTMSLSLANRAVVPKCTLVAMPETRAYPQGLRFLSGNSADAIDKNYSAAVGKVILQEAGLKPSEANKLQQMPWLDYIELANRAYGQV